MNNWIFIVMLIILMIFCLSFNRVEHLTNPDDFTDEVLNNIGPNEDVDKFKDENVTIQTFSTNEYLSMI